MPRHDRRPNRSGENGKGRAWLRQLACLAVMVLLALGVWRFLSRELPGSSLEIKPRRGPSLSTNFPNQSNPSTAATPPSSALRGPAPSSLTYRPPTNVASNVIGLLPPTASVLTNHPPATPLPLLSSIREPIGATTWLLAQLALVSRGISPGSIDGVGGAQSIEALRAFQYDNALEAHGRLDRETMNTLNFNGPVLTEFLVDASHLARLHPLPDTWLSKSQLAVLDYESLAELVGEATQSHPEFLKRLNPEVNWDAPTVGLRLIVPAAQFPPPRRAALVRISLAGKWLRAFDERGRLLAHFPCSIAAMVEKRPVGELAVAVVVKDPNYTFDPARFPESAEARTLTRKLIINPGPNNAVGVAWIGLNRPGYGIHGAPRPEQVGRAESHGCFRLANWNAEYLRQMCWVGMPVNVER